MHFGIDCSPSSIECLPLEEVSASEWPAVLNAFTVLHQPPPASSPTKQTALAGRQLLAGNFSAKDASKDSFNLSTSLAMISWKSPPAVGSQTIQRLGSADVPACTVHRHSEANFLGSNMVQPSCLEAVEQY